MAAVVIVFVSLLATLARMKFGAPQSFDWNLQFGTTVLNTLSLSWLLIAIARYERSSNDKFGEAIRRDMPTLLLALFVSLTYSAVTLFGILFKTA